MSYLAGQYQRISIFGKSISQSSLGTKDVAGITYDYRHPMLVPNIAEIRERFSVDLLACRKISFLDKNQTNVSQLSSGGSLVANFASDGERLLVQSLRQLQVALVQRDLCRSMERLSLAGQIAGFVINAASLRRQRKWIVETVPNSPAHGTEIAVHVLKEASLPQYLPFLLRYLRQLIHVCCRITNRRLPLQPSQFEDHLSLPWRDS